jgi:hypothetical protein
LKNTRVGLLILFMRRDPGVQAEEEARSFPQEKWIDRKGPAQVQIRRRRAKSTWDLVGDWSNPAVGGGQNRLLCEFFMHFHGCNRPIFQSLWTKAADRGAVSDHGSFYAFCVRGRSDACPGSAGSRPN